jgi:hypothetical protein
MKAALLVLPLLLAAGCATREDDLGGITAACETDPFRLAGGFVNLFALFLRKADQTFGRDSRRGP